MGIVTRYYGGAGRSGERRYKELVRDWKRRTLGRRTTFCVIWGHFAQGAYWDTSNSWPDGEGAVAYVDGERIADWLADRPLDLVDPTKRAAVKAWLKSLPRA